MTGIGLDGLHPFRVPLRMAFRRVTERSGVLLHGEGGWGEFSPFPEYGPEYASRWFAAALEAATLGFPAGIRDVIEVNAIVPATDPATATRLVREAGCRTVKVKVAETGQDLAADLDRVAAVRAALGPDGCIRIDANGAWDVATAVMAIGRLKQYDLEYVEQPCQTVPELREVARRAKVLVAADESIRTADDPVRVARDGGVDILVLKVQPLGGVRRALEIAEAAGAQVVVSSAVETSVGLAAGLAFAAALPELPYACGLGTASLLKADVTTAPLVPTDGMLTVRTVVPDPALLTQATPDPETAGRLLDRLGAAAAYHATTGEER